MIYENLEKYYCPQGLVAGVDEAGRGPLAGPVVAAAVILNSDKRIQGLNDSKKLTESRRNQLFDEILESALAYGIASASVDEIDRFNILQASLMAMRRAVLNLIPSPDFVLVDGNKVPLSLPCPAEAVIKGDSRVFAISAASILAKVTRDREMQRLDKIHPGYGFSQHKGYPTAMHLEALQREGVTAIHRRSYKPVQAVMASEPTQDNLL